MISYTDNLEGIGANSLDGFFDGWPKRPTAERHFELLKKSDYIVLAIDDEADFVVGFITAISDNVLSAYIPLLEVLPSYQGRGIGSKLVQRMLEKLDGFYMIDLVCDRDLERFYSRFGMKAAFCMAVRNYDKQAGVQDG
jgi:ribosomal protein S18 acetylase RimI-like enzyme